MLFMAALHVKCVSQYSFGTLQPLLNRKSNFGRDRDMKLTSLKTMPATHVKDQSHIPQDIQDSLKPTGHKYYCTTCTIGFNKQNNYQEHMAGKKHHGVQSK
jgi:hypothetical protein